MRSIQFYFLSNLFIGIWCNCINKFRAIHLTSVVWLMEYTYLIECSRCRLHDIDYNVCRLQLAIVTGGFINSSLECSCTSFALPQCLVETFAQCKIGLSLGTLDELLNFPCAWTGWLLLLLGLLVWISSGRCSGWCSCLTGATTTEHASHCMA